VCVWDVNPRVLWSCLWCGVRNDSLGGAWRCSPRLGSVLKSNFFYFSCASLFAVPLPPCTFSACLRRP
jgi:hypothetical protein